VPPPVAIVGVGARTALGPDLETTWEAIEAGRSALEVVGTWEERVPLLGARLPEAEPGADDDSVARILGHHGAILQACARAAHEAARGAEIPREAFGAYVATGMVDARPQDLARAAAASRAADGTVDLDAFFGGAFREIHPHWPLSMLGNVAVGQVATDLEIRGDDVVLASGPDAGAAAFVEALDALRDGVVRAALVAGVSERVCPASIERVFSRSGTFAHPPGEGGAALVLEDDASAKARGVRVLGHVLGAATAFDPGGREAIWRDSVAAAADEALAHAALRRADVSLVVLDGTGPLHGTRGTPFEPARSVGGLGAGAIAFGVVASLRAMKRGGTALVCALSPLGGAGAVVVDYSGEPAR
jgi:3-oxoacyl-(acyl-carrier-protein) synthase